jgi:hypothetical protein
MITYLRQVSRVKRSPAQSLLCLKVSSRLPEAHPLLLRNQESGADEFWSGPGLEEDDLGERAAGTDAQLWERHGNIVKEKERLANLARRPHGGGHHSGGGKGSLSSTTRA